MEWKRTKEDGCLVCRSTCGAFEIVQLYEELPDGERYQLNHNGYFVATFKTLTVAKGHAEWRNKHY